MTIATLLALTFPSIALADTVAVTAAPGELQAAVAAAADGDVIQMAPGVYGDVVIDGDRFLTLRPDSEVAPSREEAVLIRSIIIDGASTRAQLEDVTVRGGDFGIDLRSGAADLTRVTIADIGEESRPSSGIRVANGAALFAQDLQMRGVVSQRGAIESLMGSNVTIEGGVLANNRSMRDGGAIFVEGGTARLADLMMNDNRAENNGGAIAVVGGTVEIEDVAFTSNGGTNGGALFAGDNADVTMTDVSFDGNAAEAGGHVFVAGGDVSGARGRFTGGQARMGGAIAMEKGEFTFLNSEITYQSSAEQGAVAYVADGEFSLVYAVMYRNSAQIGAGVAQAGGDVMLRGIIATDNRGEVLATAGGTTTFDHSVLWNNEGIDGAVIGISLPSTVLQQPPGFVSPELGDFALASGSPALDRGVGEQADVDGTPSDFGMYGGPQAWPLADADGDGYTRGRDCDDSDARVNEGVKDQWYDGIDANCDRLDDFDQDGDGFSASPFNGTDCDDTDATTYPGAEEVEGDFTDSDCDGIQEPDMDGDGWGSDLDCDDDDAQVNPEAEEVWYDGIDADCLADSDYDRDGDGFDSAAFGGGDCDDADPFRSPATAEIADDGIDQDCDGEDLAAPTRDEEPEGITGEVVEENPEAVADAFARADSREMTTTGCSTTGGAGGTGALALLAGLVGLFGRRRD